MSGFLDRFRRTVTASVWKTEAEQKDAPELNDKIALGVLLYLVADADRKYLPAEDAAIRDVLKEFAGVPEGDLPVIMAAVKEAADERIDLFRFTSEVNTELAYRAKIAIIEKLFYVACADNNIDYDEHEIIGRIAGLLDVSHSDFIDAKMKIRKERGIDPR